MVRKGVSPLVSYMLVVALIFSGVIVVLSIGMPLLDRTREVASIQSAQDGLLNMDSKIREVVSYGNGSLSQVSVSPDYGEYVFEPRNDSFYYQIETDADVIADGTHVKINAVNMSSFNNGSKVRLALDYSDENINLTDARGRDRVSIGQGYYNLEIRNRGVYNDNVVLEVDYQ